MTMETTGDVVTVSTGELTPEEKPAELESVTKETEDVLYSKEETTVEPESKVDTPSEEPNEDEVAKGDDEKAEGDNDVVYDLKLSDDNVLGQDELNSVLEFAKENKLAPELAEAVWKRENELLSKLGDAESKRQDDELKEWRSSVINDPDMGGEKLKITTENARRAVKTFGSEDFTKVLNETGYGDHPEIVRFLSNIGSLMNDDALILPTRMGSKPKTAEELFYGSN